jgi:hypothetical protein
MQIEVIGCTSAGKSTLIRRILQVCHEQCIDMFLGDDFVLRQVRLNWIKHHLLRALLVNLVGLFACLVTWQNNLTLYLFATQLLFQLPISLLAKLNILRNVLKKIGIYEIIHFCSTDQQVVLVDEGVLQIAHNLFVHVSVEVNTEKLSTFAKLIPLPDAIVYVKQPESLLIDRTMKRGHKRISDHSYSNVAHFVRQAVAIFDRLVQHSVIKQRLLIFSDDQSSTMITNCHNITLRSPGLNIIHQSVTRIRNHNALLYDQ